MEKPLAQAAMGRCLPNKAWDVVETPPLADRICTLDFLIVELFVQWVGREAAIRQFFGDLVLPACMLPEGVHPIDEGSSLSLRVEDDGMHLAGLTIVIAEANVQHRQLKLLYGGQVVARAED